MTSHDAIDYSEFESEAGTGTRLTRADRFRRIERLAHLLDTAVEVPGIGLRVGLDSIVGLVPGIGDAVTTGVSLWIVREAMVLGAPKRVVGRMFTNIAVDGVVGAFPLLGDAFDVFFKANRRNVKILRRWLEAEGVLDNHDFR